MDETEATPAEFLASYLEGQGMLRWLEAEMARLGRAGLPVPADLKARARTAEAMQWEMARLTLVRSAWEEAQR